MAGAVISRKKARIEKEEESVHQIPEDVTVEILKLLPVKSLLRFTCACKTWYSIMSDHEFCNKQHHKSSCLLICEGFRTFVRVESFLKKKEEKKTPMLSTTPLPLPWFGPEPEGHTSSNKVLGSCNGLVCVDYVSSQRGRSRLILWNPSTRKFRRLPSCRRARSRRVCAGFGYDESRDDYKFVWMACKNRRAPRVNRRIDFDVFSLRSKTWRSYSHDQSSDIIIFDTDIGYQRRTGVLSNGAVHWLIRYMDRSSPCCARIFAFDLASEDHRLLELPRECGSPGEVVSLSGCLCVGTRNHMSSSIDFWMRKEYGVDSSWMKLASLPTILVVPRLIRLHMYHPIHFSSEEGSIVAMVRYPSWEGYQIMRLRVEKGAEVSYETLLSVSRNDVPIVLEETLVSVD